MQGRLEMVGPNGLEPSNLVTFEFLGPAIKQDPDLSLISICE